MDNFKEALASFLLKWGAWILTIFFGWVGYISHIKMRGKKLTPVMYLSSLGASAFIGFLAVRVCQLLWPDPHEALLKGSLFVGIASCVSKDILAWLMTRDWNRVLDFIVEWFRKKGP